MFVYKYCPKCSKRNHRTNKHCVRCGDQLTIAERFGKDVFAVTLSLIILFSSASVFASRSYFNNQHKNSTSTIKETKPIEQNNITQQSPAVETQPVETPAPKTNPQPSSTRPTNKFEYPDFTNKIPEIESMVNNCQNLLAEVNDAIKTFEQERDVKINEANEYYDSHMSGDCAIGPDAYSSCHSQYDKDIRDSKIADARETYLGLYKEALPYQTGWGSNIRNLQWLITDIKNKKQILDPIATANQYYVCINPS